MKVNGIRQKLRPIGISIFLNLKKHRTIQSQILTIISNEIISNLKLIIKFYICKSLYQEKFSFSKSDFQTYLKAVSIPALSKEEQN